MSRKKSSNDILTAQKKVKVGTRIIENGEPKALVGPESNKDTFSLDEMVEALYGPGARCVVYPPDKAVNY